jgi:hypothetical protein
VSQADWVRERLKGFGESVCSAVPAGFEAYARVLHPVEWPGHTVDDRLVRWRDVAAWSGRPLEPLSSFVSIAIPDGDPHAPMPWRGQGPATGRLWSGDADVLAEIVSDHSSAPDDCWFCLWNGYGGLSKDVPEPVFAGPLVRLPYREYLLYRGPAAAVCADSVLGPYAGRWGYTANLWWPRDHAWCVASEIDLAWSYVGGSRDLISQLLGDARLEALPAQPDDLPCEEPTWLTDIAERGAGDLIGHGETTINIFQGSIRAWIERAQFPSRTRWLCTQHQRSAWSGQGRTRLDNRAVDERDRETLTFYLLGEIESVARG